MEQRLRTKRRRTLLNRRHVRNRYMHALTRNEGLALLDKRAQHYLGMSGADFVAAWKAGRFKDAPETPSLVRVAMLLPLAEG